MTTYVLGQLELYASTCDCLAQGDNDHGEPCECACCCLLEAATTDYQDALWRLRMADLCSAVARARNVRNDHAGAAHSAQQARNYREMAERDILIYIP